MLDLEELIAVSQVVVGSVNVTALFIVVATVVVPSCDGRPLLGIGSHKIDFWVGVDFCLLQRGKLRSIQPQSLLRSEGTTQLATVPSISSAM